MWCVRNLWVTGRLWWEKKTMDSFALSAIRRQTYDDVRDVGKDLNLVQRGKQPNLFKPPAQTSYINRSRSVRECLKNTMEQFYTSTLSLYSSDTLIILLSHSHPLWHPPPYSFDIHVMVLWHSHTLLHFPSYASETLIIFLPHSPWYSVHTPIISRWFHYECDTN